MKLLKTTYWALASTSFAALLFGMAPRGGADYEGALEELRHLDDLRLSIDETYAHVERALRDAGHDVVPLVQEELERAGMSAASEQVWQEDFFWVDEGALTLPDTVSELLRLFAADPRYTARVADSDRLRAGLREGFAAREEGRDFLRDLSISCNYFNRQCNVDVDLDAAGIAGPRSGSGFEFLIPSVTVELHDVRLSDIVASKDSFFAGEAFALPNVRALSTDLYNLSVPEAIPAVARSRAAAGGRIDLFGVGVPGRSAGFIVPVLLAGLAAVLFSSMVELSRDSPEAGDLRELPVFSTTWLNVMIGLALVTVLPVAAAVLVTLRFFDSARSSSWVAVLAVAALVLLAAGMVRVSGRVRRHVRAGA